MYKRKFSKTQAAIYFAEKNERDKKLREEWDLFFINNYELTIKISKNNSVYIEGIENDFKARVSCHHQPEGFVNCHGKFNGKQYITNSYNNFPKYFNKVLEDFENYKKEVNNE